MTYELRTTYIFGTMFYTYQGHQILVDVTSDIFLHSLFRQFVCICIVPWPWSRPTFHRTCGSVNYTNLHDKSQISILFQYQLRMECRPEVFVLICFDVLYCIVRRSLLGIIFIGNIHFIAPRRLQ